MADTTMPGRVGWTQTTMADVDPDALARSLAVILATHDA
jgi:hypothetical protein